ncbi:MAG: hypothetical protein GWN84_20505 [Gammaproteobacteria bacterium]|nr:hypothetical protein [Gammaproteobacteria bacterium]NIR85143.1 hypothetical protein [Gammaproteobacteria bacterium]NIU06192.1 hypothetical protein [Gammaproteobacteria bacterium]NIX87465.1 hypothetical protein [Gammaproteobacteria bacterium]
MGRTKLKVVDRDRGWGRVKRELRKGRVEVAVGIQGPAAVAPRSEGKLTNAEIGAINEFGLGPPERSFLRATLDAERRKYIQLLKGVGDAAVAGKTSLEQGARLVGEIAVGDVKQTIADGVPPPNAPSTIERKGSSTPLIDTGQLRGSITSKVRKRRAERG